MKPALALSGTGLPGVAKMMSGMAEKSGSPEAAALR
jgi:hypothetical protein